MKIVHNKKNPDQALIIAFSDDDYDTLHQLYHLHICFGLYKLLTISMINHNDPEVVKFRSLFGNDIKGIGYLSKVEGYAKQ